MKKIIEFNQRGI